MKAASASVFVIDDDASFRKSLLRLLTSHGIHAEGFDSAAGFLSSGCASRTGCIVLDIRMPGRSGLDLQKELAEAQSTLPVIFLTGHGDIPMSVHAIKQGAADFLTKPADETILLQAVRKAMEENSRRNEEQSRLDGIRERILTLTAREYEVMCHVISGELNKQIGSDLGICEKTIKVHRARVMEKMGVRSVAELVRLCSLAGIAPIST